MKDETIIGLIKTILDYRQAMINEMNDIGYINMWTLELIQIILKDKEEK